MVDPSPRTGGQPGTARPWSRSIVAALCITRKTGRGTESAPGVLYGSPRRASAAWRPAALVVLLVAPLRFFVFLALGTKGLPGVGTDQPGTAMPCADRNVAVVCSRRKMSRGASAMP